MANWDGVGCDDPLDQLLRAAGVSLCRMSLAGDIALDAELARQLAVPTSCRLPGIVRRCVASSRRALIAFVRGLGSGKISDAIELQLSDAAGKPLWLSLSAIAGNPRLLTVRDVTGQHRTIAQLQESEEHWRCIVEFNPQWPWIADNQGQLIEMTDRWLTATGLSREEALGDSWRRLTHPDDINRVYQHICQQMAQGSSFDVRARLVMAGEYRWMRARAYPRRDATGEIVRWYGYTEDVHEQTLADERTRWNAEHDSLTDLTNRAHFNVVLEQALNASLHKLERVGVLLIDLDHFKEVNDLHGHQTGDALLVNYAAQLTAALPAGAIAARFGGDEFAVMLPAIADAEALLGHANRILALRQTVSGPASQIECRASIGASIYPEHGRNPCELMRHADIALYAAKGSGRARSLIFKPQMQHEVRERAAMVSRARTAAISGDVLAYYQPKVSLDDGALVGFEALLRWRDANGKVQSPASIHAAFEDPEVADMLGRVMLDHVLGDLMRWTHAGLAYGTVAINAAPAELRRGGFASRLIGAIEEAGLPGSAIEVEVTEGVFLGRGADEAKRAIELLHEAGIPLSLDDFGTGFASLSHLRALPVDAIKIDRSFIAHIADAEGNTPRGDRAIVSSIVSLGHNLGLNVIAEGIETPAQAEVLRRFGCKYAQGYYFGMPTPAAGIPHLIRGWGGSEDAGILAARRERSVFG